jgi:hypothetical protein
MPYTVKTTLLFMAYNLLYYLIAEELKFLKQNIHFLGTDSRRKYARQRSV